MITSIKWGLVMREWGWRSYLVSGVVSLCAAGAWADGPTYSIRISGVYEREFDAGGWVWISKCDESICPTDTFPRGTPDLPRVCAISGDPCVTTDDCPAGQGCISIAAPGDFISFEVYLEASSAESVGA